MMYLLQHVQGDTELRLVKGEHQRYYIIYCILFSLMNAQSCKFPCG